MSRAASSIRYASAATGVNFEKILTWGVIGVGLWLAYKAVTGVAKVADAATTGAANAYVNATTRPTQVLASAVLPNGQRVPMSQIRASSDFTFTYGNVRYKLTKRRADNDYDTVRV